MGIWNSIQQLLSPSIQREGEEEGSFGRTNGGRGNLEDRGTETLNLGAQTQRWHSHLVPLGVQAYSIMIESTSAID